jgi:nucleoside-diphosphate-sugar epimerase
MNRTLLTGATGFLGSRTLEYLIKRKNVGNILATGRTRRNNLPKEVSSFDIMFGDLTDNGFVNSLFDEPITNIVHCAALSSPWGKYEQFFDANICTTNNLIERSKSKGINRFIYISSPSIYFDHKNKLNISEDHPLPTRFVNFYAETKRKAEIKLEESGLDYIILRPRAIIGRGDTVIMPRLVRAVKENRLKIIGNGKNVVDLTSVENVAEAIYLSLIAKNKALNKTYNISNGSPEELWFIIEYAINELGLNFPTQKLPLGLVRRIAQGMELYAKLFTKKEPTFTRYSVGTIGLDFTLNIDKAKNLLKYKPIKSTKESIDEFIKWYLKK